MALKPILAALALSLCARTACAQATTVAAAPTPSAATSAPTAIPAAPASMVETATPNHRAATPATLQTVLVSAKCGDQIDLGAGDYPGIVRVYGLKPTCPVVIDGSLATLHNVTFSGSSNWIIERSTFGPYIYAQINITGSDHIAVRHSASTASGTAFVAIGGSTNIELANNRVSGSSGDGFDVAGDTHFVSIHDNGCVNNVPTPTHPDCVQAWSIVGKPPVSDLWIFRNVAVGATIQGFSGFDHGYGGYARVYVSDNVAATQSEWGGQWNACLGCMMINNTAYTLLGQPHGYGGARWLMTDGATEYIADSGKTVQAANVAGVAP